MKNSFNVNHKGQDVVVEQLAGDQCDNEYYLIHHAGEHRKIEYTEDDEGAGHWLDVKTNTVTEFSKEIGHLIELHTMQHKENT